MPTHNAKGVEASTKQEYPPIPEGTYSFMLDYIEEKGSKSSGAPTLYLTWVCTDTEYSNRKVFQTVGIYPKGDPSMPVAPYYLHTMHCLGIREDANGNVNYSYAEVQGVHKMLEIKIKPENGTYAAKNEVVEIKPMPYESAGNIANEVGGTIVDSELPPW